MGSNVENSRQTRRTVPGREIWLRVFVCLVFLFVSALGTFALIGSGESEERAEVVTELLLETAQEAKVEERRESRPEVARSLSYLRFVRIAGQRLARAGLGRIRCCETAPLPLRC